MNTANQRDEQQRQKEESHRLRQQRDADHLRQSKLKDEQRIAHGHRNDHWVVFGIIAFVIFWIVVAVTQL